MPDGRNPRGSRRMSRGAGRRRSSADLLVELAGRGQVRDLLSEHGIDPGALAQRREGNRGALEGEPADWHHRLLQRGGAETDLEQLLAIVRTAECDAYRLLESHGASCTNLRKAIVDRMREVGNGGMNRSAAGLRRPAPPSHRPVRSVRGGGHTASALAPRPAPAPAPEPAPRARPDSEAAPEPRATLEALDVTLLPPLEGRETELARLADSLLRSSPRPPLLVGEHGSGRTLLACHLARLLGRPVYRLLANDYEEDEDLREALREVASHGGVAILDDLDRLIAETPPTFLNALAAAWSSGEPPLITIVSHETRSRLEAWMPGLRDSLDPVVLTPLDGVSAHAAVKLGVDRVLERHGLTLARGAHASDLARLADRFLTGLAMPGRALDLLDLACARCVREGRSEVGLETWVDVVCERTGLPHDRVAGGSDQDLLELDQEIGRRIVGHEPVVSTLCQLIRRNRAGFSSDRPIATSLLLGPSGVGKTEIAKAIADALFEDGKSALLRLDMSEYAEAHAVARVVGAPPGYVGHEQGGALTDPLIRRPHRVVLLDEIEKAHRDVHQLLLQVFDEGRLTDGRGRTVDFRHAVIIMTSNLGARLMEAGDAEDEEILHSARTAFPVELWNRIEAPLVLRPLERDEMLRICRRLASASSNRLLAERGIQYELDDAACEYLVDIAGEDPALGARPLRHLLAREIESLIANSILRGQFRAGNRVRVSYDGEYLSLGLLGRA